MRGKPREKTQQENQNETGKGTNRKLGMEFFR